ncbi:ScbR family autoregulator-binding transcription factor [Streptomyces qinzhouensis]|uniref:TetR/AcrR family transcriptional regulator n=1 Tax=Streptomyces qinzhouensis TaxID=2599401 RepID=A0A5B8IEZ2_9ACTN|nr:ScbR family autoregulator-binding transcription factor [Streptomyces qinzhouensis]QDY76642.1 TetR/AcrR family transcriptional regulator [Streptomyces qinzhouensis]
MAQQERAIRTRQKIIVEAAKVFDEVGYEATKITDILERAGLTKGALYFHFESKRELAQAVLDAQADVLPEIAPHELKLQEAIDGAQVLSRLLQPKTGDPIFQGSVRLTVDAGSAKDGLDRRVPMRAWNEINQIKFREAQMNGELLPHLDIEAVSWMMTATFTGTQVMSSIMTNRQDMPERMADLHRMLLASIAVPGVLARLDFSPERGRRLYEQAVKGAARGALSGGAAG